MTSQPLLLSALIVISLSFFTSHGFDLSKFSIYSPLNYSQLPNFRNASKLQIPYNPFIPLWIRPNNSSNPNQYGWWHNRNQRSVPEQKFINSCVPPWRSYCNGTHHLDVGCLHYADKPLFIHEYHKKGGFFGISGPEKIVYYPPVGVRHNKTISAIRVVDQKCNNKGGYAQIISGGVGYNRTTIRLYAHYRGEFHFAVYIFGLPY